MQVLGPAADEGGAALQMVTVAVVKMMEVNGDGNSGGNEMIQVLETMRYKTALTA